ncbi:MAG: hypothetical protein Kow00124_20880 [Anaerolineae bacterium]
MVETHKYAMGLVEGPVRAVFIDTPAGFQLNADLLGQRAVEYFAQSLNSPLRIVSYKDAARASADETQAAVTALHEASYIFAGPGSPTYALRSWQGSPLPDAMAETLARGGCLVFASAAALTLGRFTIPVYEVYKVGEAPHWVSGLNILGHAGLDVAVVPHWNNTSGGDHDTRFCFMGEPRWRDLEGQLPPSTAVLGIDEHTACVLRIDQNVCEVRGVGRVTVRRAGQEQTFGPGESFSLDLLRPAPGKDRYHAVGAPHHQVGVPDWDSIRTRHDALFVPGPPAREPLTTYVYDLLGILSAACAAGDHLTYRQAEDVLREALIYLLAAMHTAPPDVDGLIGPYVDLLLTLRADMRARKQWDQADAVRDGLKALGITVQDGPDGSTWQRE